MSHAEPIKDAHTIASAVQDLIETGLRRCGAIGPDEVIMHFDLVTLVRRMDDEGVHGRREHWCPPGAEPHLSESCLRNQARRIADRLH